MLMNAMICSGPPIYPIFRFDLTIIRILFHHSWRDSFIFFKYPYKGGSICIANHFCHLGYRISLSREQFPGMPGTYLIDVVQQSGVGFPLEKLADSGGRHLKSDGYTVYT